MPSVQWSDIRTERFVHLWTQTNLSAAQIAEEMGGFQDYADGGRCAVLGKAHRMNLSTRGTGITGRRGDGDARRLGLAPRPVKIPPIREVAASPYKIDRAPMSRAHAGMRVLGHSELRRMTKEPSKSELRDLLAQAVRNTAALQQSEAS